MYTMLTEHFTLSFLSVYLLNITVNYVTLLDQISSNTADPVTESLSEESQSNPTSASSQSQANFHWGQMVYGK